MNPYTNKNFLTRFVALLSEYIATPDFSLPGRLYLMALISLGTDASPNDIAPDEFGCAETVDSIYKRAFGAYIAGSITLSTAKLYTKFLSDTTHWLEVAKPRQGDIVISPTGHGNGKIMGHVGIVGSGVNIMSNNSYTGYFEENYTLETWKARYVGSGGLPMRFFRRV